MDNYDALASERKVIWYRADAIHDGCFPGSKAWLAAKSAEAELAAWDAAHPDFIAEKKRRAIEAKAAKQAEFSKRDILGL